jgi:hypothetical protein
MPYLDDCVCENPNTPHCTNIKAHCLPIQCKNCGYRKWDNEARQKRIWKASRVPSSLYTMNLAALSVRNSTSNTPSSVYANVNWNQSSDRALPARSKTSPTAGYVPTRGSSTRSTRTSHKPGGSGPNLYGVDIKHNSYARYLARKKAGHIRTTKVVPTPSCKTKYCWTGNKLNSFGLVNNSNQCGC